MKTMKKITVNLSISLIALFFIGCAVKKTPSQDISIHAEATTTIMKSEPDWYKNCYNMPEYKLFLIGKGEAASRDKLLSRKRAINALVNDLQRKKDVIAKGRADDFTEEQGTNASSKIIAKFESVEQSVWEGAVQDWAELNSETVIEPSVDANNQPYNIYRTYTIGGLDLNKAHKSLMAELENDQELLIAFKKNKSDEKLLEELVRYKDHFQKNY